MLRVLLSMMVPCFALGITGLIVTSIGRLLLAVGVQVSVPLAAGLTVAIIVLGALAAAFTSRMATNRGGTPH